MNRRRLNRKWQSPARVLILGFLGLILLGGILLSQPFAARPGVEVSFLDGLFTSTSAVCVTGLVVKDTYTTFSHVGQLIILTLIQIGGLGFMSMVTFVAVLTGRKILLHERVLLQEALNQGSVEGVVRLALTILKVTLAFELTGAVLLTLIWFKQLGWAKAAYFGIFHAVSAFNNAGFDLFGNFSSLTSQVSNIPVNLVIGSLIIFGGLGFAVIAELLKFKSWHRLSLHSKIVLYATAGLLALGFVVFAILEWRNPSTLGNLSLGNKLLASAFQSVTPRTAGFNTVDMSKLKGATTLFLMVLMFIGASPGSTGGGIKTTTFATTVIGLWSLAKGSSDFNLAGRRLSKDQVFKAVAIGLLAMGLVITAAILLEFTEKVPIAAALFEATSAFGTVGLSLGITPGLSAFGKAILMFTMFAGRLGPFTLAIALGQTKPTGVRYPEEKIIIG